MSAMTSEREAFEKWLTEGNTNPESPPRDKHDRYVEQDVRYMWSAWQASAHLDQPAQAVDVGVVGFITHSMDKMSRMDMTEAGLLLGVGRHALYTRALSGEKAGPVGDGWQPIETAPKDKRILCVWLGAPGCEEVDVAVNCTETTRGQVVGWCSPHDCDDRYCAPDYWMPIKPLPASPAPDKEGL